MSSDTDIEEEYILTNIRCDDNPTNEIVTSPKGGYGPVTKTMV